MSKFVLALAAAGLIGCGASAAGAAQLSHQDQTFMKEAAQGNLAEIQAGQLAQQRGTTQPVKQLGQTLVTDHQEMNQKLEQFAQQNNVTLPTSPTSAHQKQMNSLEKLQGQKFDHSFARDEVSDHEKDIAKFQKEAKSTHDPALRQMVEQSVPVLQKHLQMAKEAQTAG